MKERRKKHSVCIMTLLLLLGVTGCQGISSSKVEETDLTTETTAEVQEQELQQLEGFVGEDKYEQEVRRPEVDLNIFVDLVGYSCEDSKHAYFIGDNLKEQFSVYRKEDNRIVYSGRIEDAVTDELTGKVVSRGDFSTLTDPGVYYIQTAIIGRSYSFRITENRYIKQFQELQNSFLEMKPARYYGLKQPQQKLSQVATSFLNLTLSYEFFAQEMKEEYQAKLAEHAQWILDAASQMDYSTCEADGLYTLSTALAVYSVTGQGSDAALARNCLSEAQKAYQTAARQTASENAGQEAETKQSVADAQYMAAAALYKANGFNTYHTVVKNRFAPAKGRSVSANETEKNDVSNFYTFYGDLIYMATTKSVDTTICSQQMTQMLTECGKMSDAAAHAPFGLGSRALEDTDQLFRLTQLAMADYVIVSREYRNACKEQIHYLLRNTETDNLDFMTRSALLLIMSDLAESEEEE